MGEKDKFPLGQAAKGGTYWSEEFEFKSVDDGEFLNVLNTRTDAQEWSLRKIIR